MCYLNSAFTLFCYTLQTHTVKLEIIYFSIGIRAWYTLFKFNY